MDDSCHDQNKQEAVPVHTNSDTHTHTAASWRYLLQKKFHFYIEQVSSRRNCFAVLVWQNGIAMNVPQKDQRSFACLDNQGTPLPLELQLGKVKEKVVTI